MKFGDIVKCDLQKSHECEVTTHVIAGIMSYAMDTQDVFLLCTEQEVGMPCGKHALSQTGEANFSLAKKYRKRYLERFPGRLA